MELFNYNELRLLKSKCYTADAQTGKGRSTLLTDRRWYGVLFVTFVKSFFCLFSLMFNCSYTCMLWELWLHIATDLWRVEKIIGNFIFWNKLSPGYSTSSLQLDKPFLLVMGPLTQTLLCQRDHCLQKAPSLPQLTPLPKLYWQQHTEMVNSPIFTAGIWWFD